MALAFRGATIGDRVWNDLNSNGQQDGPELGVPGAIVKLLDTSDAVLLTTATDVNGNYSFINVTPGSYKVQFVKPAGFNFTTPNIGADATDSDADTVTGMTGVFAVVAGETEQHDRRRLAVHQSQFERTRLERLEPQWTTRCG